MGRNKRTGTAANAAGQGAERAGAHGAADMGETMPQGAERVQGNSDGNADAPAETVTERLLREEREAAESAAAELAAKREKADRETAERAEREAAELAKREAAAKAEAERKRKADIAAKQSRAAQIERMFKSKRVQVEKTYACFERILAAVQVYAGAMKRGEAMTIGGAYEQTFDDWKEATGAAFGSLKNALLSRNGLDFYMGGSRYCEGLRRELADIRDYLNAQGVTE